jgi:hypothetical protein
MTAYLDECCQENSTSVWRKRETEECEKKYVVIECFFFFFFFFLFCLFLYTF